MGIDDQGLEDSLLRLLCRHCFMNTIANGLEVSSASDWRVRSSCPFKSRTYSRGRRSRCRRFGGARHRALGLPFFIKGLAISIGIAAGANLAAASGRWTAPSTAPRPMDVALGGSPPAIGLFRNGSGPDGTIQERQSYSCPAASSQSRSISASGERLFAWISQ